MMQKVVCADLAAHSRRKMPKPSRPSSRPDRAANSREKEEAGFARKPLKALQDTNHSSRARSSGTARSGERALLKVNTQGAPCRTKARATPRSEWNRCKAPGKRRSQARPRRQSRKHRPGS